MKLPALSARSSILQYALGHHSGVGVRATALLVLMVLAGLLLVRVLQGNRMDRDIAALREQRIDLDARTSRLVTTRSPTKAASNTPSSGRTAKADASLTEEQRRGLNAVIRQLNTPWQDLFDQLERSTPPDVALISIEPDARRGSIRLQAEAKTLETLLNYAAQLQQRGVLGRLTYSKHETNEQDNNKPLRLSVDIEMRMPQRLLPPNTDTRISDVVAASGAAK
jgi:Tfp pilus assembly protein PilN